MLRNNKAQKALTWIAEAGNAYGKNKQISYPTPKGVEQIYTHVKPLSGFYAFFMIFSVGVTYGYSSGPPQRFNAFSVTVRNVSK